MKSWFSFALPIGIIVGFAIGLLIFEIGRISILRECPPAQHGERLLASEQRADATICTYADGWNGYGHMITARKL